MEKNLPHGFDKSADLLSKRHKEITRKIFSNYVCFSKSPNFKYVCVSRLLYFPFIEMSSVIHNISKAQKNICNLNNVRHAIIQFLRKKKSAGHVNVTFVLFRQTSRSRLFQWGQNFYESLFDLFYSRF